VYGKEKNNMKVVQVNKLYYPFVGGVEKVVYDISNEIKNSVDVEVLVCNTENKLVKEEIEDVKVTRTASLGIYFSMPVSLSFPKYLRSYDADIYHFHFPFPLADISYMLGRKIKGKVVVTWHSDIVKQKLMLKFYGPILRRFLKKHADVILATSPQLIESSPFLSEVKDKCKVVPLGIDVDKYKITETVNQNVDKIHEKYGDNLILFVGRLIYYKGVEYLVRAMENVSKGKLLIVGEGKLKDELISLTKELNLEDKIEFLGKASDEELISYYHACDLFVLPSIAKSEAFGLVQLESMACGKPVISTNLPTGVPFVNENGKTGIVVEPENSAQLSEAINELMNDDNKRQQYGQYAKDRVEKVFTREKMAENVLDIYKELLREK